MSEDGRVSGGGVGGKSRILATGSGARICAASRPSRRPQVDDARVSLTHPALGGGWVRVDTQLRLRALVERTADDLAGQRIGQFALLEQHAAVAHDIVDTDRRAPD